MKTELAAYFLAEKREALLFVSSGLAAMALTALLWRGPYRGAGLPLVLVGLIQLGVGCSVFVRTDFQLAELRAQLDADPAKLRAIEVPRMERVMANFRVYKLVELVVLALGLALTFLLPANELAYSAGVGCVAQGAFMLVLDLVAEHRGAAYLAALRSPG